MFVTFAVNNNAVLCVTTKCLCRVASSKQGTSHVALDAGHLLFLLCCHDVCQQPKKKKYDKEVAALVPMSSVSGGRGRGRERAKKKKKESDVRLTARCSAFIVVYHLHLAPLFMYSTFLTHASTITVLPFWCH